NCSLMGYLRDNARHQNPIFPASLSKYYPIDLLPLPIPHHSLSRVNITSTCVPKKLPVFPSKIKNMLTALRARFFKKISPRAARGDMMLPSSPKNPCFAVFSLKLMSTRISATCAAEKISQRRAHKCEKVFAQKPYVLRGFHLNTF